MEKKLVEQLKKSVTQLHDVHARYEEEVKEFKEARAETSKMLEDQHAEVKRLEKRLEEYETERNRKFRAGEDGMNGQSEEQLKRKETFLRFIRKGGALAEMSQEDIKVLKDIDTKYKALVEDSVGEIIVPEDVDREITKALQKQTVLRQLARTLTTSSNRVKRYEFNGLLAGFGKLERHYASGDKTIKDYESELKPGEKYIYVNNLYGYTEFGEDLLMDSEFNLEQMLVELFGEAMAYAENYAYLNGAGAEEEEPEGILNAKGVERITHDADNPLDSILKLQYAVPDRYRQNGVYLYSSDAELMVRTIKDETGNYMWQPPVQAGLPATLFGKPAYVQDTFEGDDAVVFGDFRAGYTIVENKGMSIKKYDQSEAAILNDILPFRAKKRVGGGVSNAQALAILAMDVPTIGGGNGEETTP